MPLAAPADDRHHVPRADPRWRESFYFSFFDDRLGLGGFSSIGKRAARGHSGSINVLWGPERPTLLAYELDQYEVHDSPIDVRGLRYEPASALGPWRLAFDGELNDGGTGVECDAAALRSVADGSAPSVPVAYDLTFTPEAPAYLYEQNDAWAELFDGHVDEVGRVTGTITIAGETHDVDARAAKDHSWGVRDWAKPKGWRWIDVVGDGLTEVTLWRATFDGETWVGDGAVYSGGETVPLTGYREQLRREDGLPVAAHIELDAGGRTHVLDAEIVRVVPMFFSGSEDGVKRTSRIDRTLMRCTLDGAAGWANVEVQGQLPG
jgi:hypothetical protein